MALEATLIYLLGDAGRQEKLKGLLLIYVDLLVRAASPAGHSASEASPGAVRAL